VLIQVTKARVTIKRGSRLGLPCGGEELTRVNSRNKGVYNRVSDVGGGRKRHLQCGKVTRKRGGEKDRSNGGGNQLP